MLKKLKRLFADREPEDVLPPPETPEKPRNAPIPVPCFDQRMPQPLLHSAAGRSKISFLVIVYKMPDQAEKTLQSLSVPYQRGVTEDDYEVIVVENQDHAVGRRLHISLEIAIAHRGRGRESTLAILRVLQATAPVGESREPLTGQIGMRNHAMSHGLS